MTAGVTAAAPPVPRVGHWSPPPPPLHVVPPTPVPPKLYAGRFRTVAAYERHKLAVAARAIRQRHPKLTAEQATVEALARRAWHELHPGTKVGNGWTLAEHLTAQRGREERAARRRQPAERNLREHVRQAVRRRDAGRGQLGRLDPVTNRRVITRR